MLTLLEVTLNDSTKSVKVVTHQWLSSVTTALHLMCVCIFNPVLPANVIPYD